MDAGDVNGCDVFGGWSLVIVCSEFWCCCLPDLTVFDNAGYCSSRSMLFDFCEMLFVFITVVTTVASVAVVGVVAEVVWVLATLLLSW